MAILLKSTKELIFDTAIKIISEFGFERADMRSIAMGANIKVASIYNHFSCKQDILDLILDYYAEHFFDNCLPEEEIKKIIREGSKKEIIASLLFTFEHEDEKLYQRMVLISKIVYMHLFQERKAKEIFQTKMTRESEIFIQRMLDYAVEVKTLAPFDTKTYSVLFVGCRNVMGIKAFVEPGYIVGQLEEENLLHELLIDMLPL